MARRGGATFVVREQGRLQRGGVATSNTFGVLARRTKAQASARRRRARRARWSGIRVGFWNVNGVRVKETQLRDVVHQRRLDVLGVGETFLGASEELPWDGFTWFGVGNARRLRG